MPIRERVCTARLLSCLEIQAILVALEKGSPSFFLGVGDGWKDFFRVVVAGEGSMIYAVLFRPRDAAGTFFLNCCSFVRG